MATLEEQSISVDDVARTLPDDTVLVEFVKIVDFDLGQELFLDTARYWAFVLRSGGTVKAYDLGEADSLESEISRALGLLRTGDPFVPAPQLDARSGLYERLWSPLVEALDDAKSVAISPDAALALVPFGALLGPDSRFVIEDYTL
jgi:hypothetical protein